MDLLNIIKLARIISKLEKVDSDQGPITVEAIEPGKEIFIDGPDGETIPAPDGAYLIEDGKRKVKVIDGKIETIEEITVNPDTVPVDQKEEKRKCEEMPKEEEPEKKEEEKPAEEPEKKEEEVKTEEMPTESDAKIAELVAEIAEKEAKIAELEAEIEALKNAPVKTDMKKVQNVSPFKIYKH